MQDEAGVTKALQVAVLVNAASLAASQGHLQQVELLCFHSTPLYMHCAMHT